MQTPAVKYHNFILEVIDQTALPSEFNYIRLENPEETFLAIKQLKVRGAPLIGIVAAYALAVFSHSIRNRKHNSFLSSMDQAVDYLGSSRPTAVNLAWALHRMQNVYRQHAVSSTEEISLLLDREARKIQDEDFQSCKMIGEFGAALFTGKVNILTHCNTGSLATGGWGTALGVVYAAQARGLEVHVYVDETRPLGQGARLTLWELLQNQVPCTLITDSMAAAMMKQGRIDVVIFGADRIARNGDVANKIGSYGLSVLAGFHNIPCYCAAPVSTFDLSLKNGEQIPIEQRDKQEILQFYNYDVTLLGLIKVENPAFDVTPAGHLTGIITERGILSQPLKESINKLLT